MANSVPQIWQTIGEYARMTPSPHNTQPCRLHVVDDTHAQVVFVPSRGLYIADPSGRFTEAALGVFVEICKIAAAANGYRLEYDYTFQPLYPNGDHETLQTVANLTLVPDTRVADLPVELITQRHTSRLPYDNRPVPEAVVAELQTEAAKWGHQLFMRNDPEAIRWVVELNKESLFNDLEDNAIREELKRWLRYSPKEAKAKKDGLSAEAMQMPGTLMRSFFYHHKIWTMPGLKQLVAWIYMSTMRGIANIAWIQGPFVTTKDRIRTGHLLIRLWLILTKHGVYLHPYGSVITNDVSRTAMLKKMHIGDEEGGNKMVWLLLRLGYSKEPPRSERINPEELFV